MQYHSKKKVAPLLRIFTFSDKISWLEIFEFINVFILYD